MSMPNMLVGFSKVFLDNMLGGGMLGFGGVGFASSGILSSNAQKEKK